MNAHKVNLTTIRGPAELSGGFWLSLSPQHLSKSQQWKLLCMNHAGQGQLGCRQLWVSKLNHSAYEEKNKTSRFLPLVALIIEFHSAVHCHRVKFKSGTLKPQWAHLWWLHYDICWRLCNVHGLHLLPLLFDCLSCTRNVIDKGKFTKNMN